jgi:hypothetical protein
MKKHVENKKEAAKGTKKATPKAVEKADTKSETGTDTSTTPTAENVVANADTTKSDEGQSKTVEPEKSLLPTMTAEFCLQDQKYWEGKDDIYNPASKDCVTCGKDFPNQPASCAARTAFLAAGTVKKTRKAGTPKVKVPKDGRLPQSLQIDEYIKAGMSIETMTATLATRDFSGDLKQALARNMSHLKAIMSGRYCKAELMRPYLRNFSDADAKTIGYTKPAAEPVAPIAAA